MSGRQWSLWLGPPAALVAVAVVLGAFQPKVEAGGRVTPAPVGACTDPAPTLRSVAAARGTWWRLVDGLDGNGTLVGRTLAAGRGGATNLTLALDAESSASGPVGGIVVVTSDDGRFSEVRLVSAILGCSWLVQRSEDVVRSAILDPSTGTVLAHLLTRETRADKGTWRITGKGPDAQAQLVLGPLPAQPNLGPIWATELRLDAKGGRLAVQSCAEEGCLTRVIALGGASGGAGAPVGGAGQGGILGFAGDQLVTWSHCPGWPCAIQAWPLVGARPATLVEQAVGAGMTADGRYLIAVLDEDGRATRMDLVGGSSRRIGGIAAGVVPLGGGGNAYAGYEVGPAEIALAAPGADAYAFDPATAAPAP